MFQGNPEFQKCLCTWFQKRSTGYVLEPLVSCRIFPLISWRIQGIPSRPLAWSPVLSLLAKNPPVHVKLHRHKICYWFRHHWWSPAQYQSVEKRGLIFRMFRANYQHEALLFVPVTSICPRNYVSSNSHATREAPPQIFWRRRGNGFFGGLTNTPSFYQMINSLEWASMNIGNRQVSIKLSY